MNRKLVVSITSLACILGATAGYARHWLDQQAFEHRPIPAEVERSTVLLAHGLEPNSTRSVDPPSDSASLANEGALASKKVDSIEKIAPFPRVRKSRTPPLTATHNTLLVGIDRRPGQRWGGLTDTLIVAVASKATGHLGLVSIPRDLYVEIPDHDPGRINSVYPLALVAKKDPILALKSVVADTLGLPINHAVAIDLSVFEKTVDLLEGVDVEVACPLVDNFVDERTESKRRLLNVEAGMQHMDGVTAAMYIRSRHGRSDFSRARRQQAVLRGLQRSFLSANGISRMDDLLKLFGKSIESDMTRGQFLSLARLAVGIDTTKVHGLVLGGKHVQYWRSPKGASVLLPKHDVIYKSLSKLFSKAAPGARTGTQPCPPADVALKRKRRTTPPKVAADGNRERQVAKMDDPNGVTKEQIAHRKPNGQTLEK